MKLSIALLAAAFAAAALAQTPFEFDVVRQLIEGEPHVSVLRIEIMRDIPVEGETTLGLSARAGLYLWSDENAIYPDSQTDRDVLFDGAVLYRAAAPRDRLRRILSVVSTNLHRYSGIGADHLELDFVSTDDMSWLKIRMPMTLVEEYLNGDLSDLEMWRRVEIWGAEVGTCTFGLQVRPPRALSGGVASADTVTVIRYPSASRHAWKSALLPGWGQLAAGRGIGWINLAVEAGGIFLLTDEDNREAGMAVLATNHIVSLMDLL